MSEDEFWSITPSQFNALCKRWAARVEREQYNSALICSVLANINRDAKKRRKPFAPQDFMPRKKEASKRQTVDQQRAVIIALNRMLGGEDRRASS